MALAALVLLAGPAGGALASEPAPTGGIGFEAPAITPARPAPGETVQVALVAQARGLVADGGFVSATFVASVVAPDGTTVELERRPNQVFGAWQLRRYTVAWAIPPDRAPAVSTLLLQLLTADGSELARRQEDLPVGGGAGPPPPAPEPPPAIPSEGHALAITGSAVFVEQMRAALDLLKATSPADYAVVATYVREIKEGPRSFSWGGSRTIQIGRTNADQPGYAGSLILHEAVHVKNWFSNDLPVYGCEGEAKSLRAQAAYLRLLGDASMADWVEGLIGSWC
jgi:hypothetical protein